MSKILKTAAGLLPGKLPMMPELKNSLATLSSMFGSDSGMSETENTVLALVKSILAVDGVIPPARLDMFRQLAEESYGIAASQRKLHQLLEIQPVSSVNEAADKLYGLSTEKKEEIICFLINLSVSADNSKFEELSQLASAIGVSESLFNAIAEKAAVDFKRRAKILRSGAGLLVAVIVIAVFILTATLLRSVIFGLIAAYVLLPVEKFFERRLRRKKGFFYNTSKTLELLASPLLKLSARLMRKDDSSSAPDSRKEQKKIIEKAVGFTAFTLFVLLFAATLGLTAMTGKYVSRFSSSVRDWKNNTSQQTDAAKPGLVKKAGSDEQKVSPDSPTPMVEKALGDVSIRLDGIRKKFERLPLVATAVTYMEKIINNPDIRSKIIQFVARKTGGVLSFATGVVGTVVAFFCDLLLTIFFGLLFLLKFSELNTDDKKQFSAGNYIVKSIFNGKWLPRSSAETLEDAQRIIDGTLNRLKIWVKGYLTLVLVDATVYTTLFYFLGVPYFPLLGLLAGCGILLPYIGPIVSCALTLLVTLASGGCTGTQLTLILICYLIYNGIIEQFILYPAVIGESLGLTTLETIIVVLLGAIFAGIPGMILALPTASVVKYSVPRIYKCWNPQKGEQQ